ncbi:hypothetical protein [Rhodoblastus sp.]|uniref:hypothetical protein n=1 Tax=Rhodoblastus sp. TaxID=1962975 RepID=UPI0026332A18|nr:hypothetical protein [Rhodoblastus sp.]
MPNRAPQGPPPSIAHLKAQGVAGVSTFCRACGHSGAVAFDALGLPDDVLFPMIARARRFRCSACGARDCGVMPDWSGYRAPGIGGGLKQAVD